MCQFEEKASLFSGDAFCSARLRIVSAWECAFLLCIVALLGWSWQRSRARTSEIRRLAETIGFHYLGNALPRSLPLSGLPPRIASIWNVLDGEQHGRRVIVFDCRFGEGKGSWRRTVIAVHAEQSSITASAFDPDIRVVQIREWTFLYRPKELVLIPRGLTPVPELTAYLDVI